MSSFLWLDFLKGAPGLDSPFLYEYHGAYRFFDETSQGCPQIVMVIRDRHNYLAPEAQCGIRLRKVGLPLVFAADCGLHLPTDMQQARAGPLPAYLTQHHLSERKSWSSQNLAFSLYSRLLSWFSNAVVFFEKEHGGMAPILHISASWIWFAKGGDGGWPRPRVLIFGAHLGDVEQALAMEILQNFNHQKTLSFNAAKIAWKKCFSGITTVFHESPNFPLQQILDASLHIHQEKLVRYAAISVSHFKPLFSAACGHFSRPEIMPLSLLEVSRINNPVPKDMPFHVEELVRAVAEGEERLDHIVRLIASALLLDSHTPDAHGACVFSTLPFRRSLFAN